MPEEKRILSAASSEGCEGMWRWRGGGGEGQRMRKKRRIRIAKNFQMLPPSELNGRTEDSSTHSEGQSVANKKPCTVGLDTKSLPHLPNLRSKRSYKHSNHDDNRQKQQQQKTTQESM